MVRTNTKKQTQIQKRDKVYPKYVTVQPGPPVCDEAFDLLDKMLQFDPRKRLSVEDALRHPYLKTLHHEDDACHMIRTFTSITFHHHGTPRSFNDVASCAVVLRTSKFTGY